AVLAAPIGEIGAAVRTAPPEQAELALVVAEEDEVLAEQTHRHHRPLALELLGERRWVPILPQQLAAGRARPDAGDAVVLFLADHGGSQGPVQDRFCGARA